MRARNRFPGDADSTGWRLGLRTAWRTDLPSVEASIVPADTLTSNPSVAPAAHLLLHLQKRAENSRTTKHKNQ